MVRRKKILLESSVPHEGLCVINPGVLTEPPEGEGPQ